MRARPWLALLRAWLVPTPGALARAGASDETIRAASRALAGARQTRVASERLLLEGGGAEAIRLGARAAAEMTEALASFPDGDARREQRRRSFERGRDALGPLPDLDDDTTPGQRARLGRLLVAHSALEENLDPDLRDARAVKRLRLTRAAQVASLVFAAWAVFDLICWKVAGTSVHASSEYSPLYSAARAFDGDPQTEWSASDAAPSLEVSFRRARRLRRVNVLKGHVLPLRGADAVRVQCLRSGAVKGEWTATLGESASKTPVPVEVQGMTCDQVVLHPLAKPPLRGSSIAEVTFE